MFQLHRTHKEKERERETTKFYISKMIRKFEVLKEWDQNYKVSSFHLTPSLSTILDEIVKKNTHSLPKLAFKRGIRQPTFSQGDQAYINGKRYFAFSARMLYSYPLHSITTLVSPEEVHTYFWCPQPNTTTLRNYVEEMNHNRFKGKRKKDQIAQNDFSWGSSIKLFRGLYITRVSMFREHKFGEL